MSMEISGGYAHAKTDYVRLAKDEQPLDRTDKEKEVKGAQNDVKPSAPQDEYVSSEKAGAKPTGLYRVGQDENGNRKIYYDDPQKAGTPDDSKEDKTGKPKVKQKEPDDSEEKCVGNTNQVDREIKELKAKKKQLEQQIQAASEDENKVKELEKELAQVESELSRKDNDTYRRQHSQFTE